MHRPQITLLGGRASARTLNGFSSRRPCVRPCGIYGRRSCSRTWFSLALCVCPPNDYSITAWTGGLYLSMVTIRFYSIRTDIFVLILWLSSRREPLGVTLPGRPPIRIQVGLSRCNRPHLSGKRFLISVDFKHIMWRHLHCRYLTRSRLRYKSLK